MVSTWTISICESVKQADGTLVNQTCDSLVAIPIAAEMESLNVSNAAAIAVYEWCRCHGLPVAPTGA